MYTILVHLSQFAEPMKPETVLEVYQLFLDGECSTNARLADNLKTTLRRYILPELGFPPDMLRQNFEGCLAKISLHQFQNVEELLDQVLEASKEDEKPLSNGAIRNYRSALNRFLQWLRKQPWYFEFPKPDYENRAPKLSIGKGVPRYAEDQRQLNEKFENLNVTDLRSYLLKKQELSPTLIEQLDQLRLYWTDVEVVERKGPAMQAQIFMTCSLCIQTILGWLHKEKQISVEKLNLSNVAELETLQSFIDWGLEKHYKDYPWASDVAKVAVLVAKWLNPQAKHYNFGDVLQVQELRKYIRSLNLKREDIGTYGLQPKELPSKTKIQLNSFQKFWTDTEVPERKKPPISERTFTGYSSSILWFLGWLHNVQGEALENLELAHFAELTLLKQFVAWGINQRGNGYGWATNIGYASMAVAKWLNPQSKSRDFKDIALVEDIREYVRYLREQHRNEEPRQNLDQKRLTFQEAQQVVEYLKQCCAPLDKYGDDRSEQAIMSSWQRYLIVAILTYCPVRQHELRELTLNETLFREADGYWVKLTSKQHKAGRKSRKGREYPIPKHLTEDLDIWLRKWRSRVPTAHNLVFIQMRANHHPESLGQPLEAGNMTDLVSSAVHNATAVLFDEPKDTTPHMFRRIAITYQRRYGRPEQKEPLAELMGHTVEEADRTYNEESIREKSQKAEGWWQLNPQLANEQMNYFQPKQPVDGWIEEDEYKLEHLEASSYQNDHLRKLRDQAVLVLWAMQELAWAEMHRLNVGDLVQQEGLYRLVISKKDGTRDKQLLLKEAIAKILIKYIEERKKFGEELTEMSSLFIGIGNRSGGQRLLPGSIQGILRYYIGKVSSIS
jgi:site-specific recombinase XerD